MPPADTRPQEGSPRTHNKHLYLSTVTSDMAKDADTDDSAHTLSEVSAAALGKSSPAISTEDLCTQAISPDASSKWGADLERQSTPLLGSVVSPSDPTALEHTTASEN